jgi:PleD family two-component response regulator
MCLATSPECHNGRRGISYAISIPLIPGEMPEISFSGEEIMKKVLLVEDDAEWRILLSMVVKRAGFQVVAATTGNAAVKVAGSEHPDLILMDLA